MSSPAYYIITGGTSGIGLEAAKAIATAKPNDKVIITGRVSNQNVAALTPVPAAGRAAAQRRTSQV
jgi:NAD(P)-dependent dehydrogenase (short-subunit alcohol dehydrogenase family)